MISNFWPIDAIETDTTAPGQKGLTPHSQLTHQAMS